MQVPLFPLRAVLFPGGLLPLRVFELRYTDMVRDCMRSGTPFGVVLRTDPEDVADNPDQPAIPEGHYHVGTLASVVDFDMREPGILMIAAQGGQRFTIENTHAQRNGLIVAQVALIPADEPASIASEYAVCVEVLDRVVREIEHQFKVATKAGENPFCRMVSKPYGLDDAVWVSNRHAELMPIPLVTKLALLGLRDSNERLALVHAFLKDQDVI